MKLLLELTSSFGGQINQKKLSDAVLSALEDQANELLFECGERLGNADQDSIG